MGGRGGAVLLQYKAVHPMYGSCELSSTPIATKGSTHRSSMQRCMRLGKEAVHRAQLPMGTLGVAHSPLPPKHSADVFIRVGACGTGEIISRTQHGRAEQVHADGPNSNTACDQQPAGLAGPHTGHTRAAAAGPAQRHNVTISRSITCCNNNTCTCTHHVFLQSLTYALPPCELPQRPRGRST